MIFNEQNLKLNAIDRKQYSIDTSVKIFFYKYHEMNFTFC